MKIESFYLTKAKNIARIFRTNLQYFYSGGWAGKKFSTKMFKLIIYLLKLPYAIVNALLLIPRPLVFRQISFVITSKCTLRCDKCANLMQYYTSECRAKEIPIERCLATVDAFFNAIDKVFEFNIIGGEPFLHNDLADILKHLIKQPKLLKISITTNGTLVPSSETLRILKHPKIVVSISDYEELSRKRNELKALFEKHSICYKLNRIDNWNDYGDVNHRNRDFKLLQRIYMSCRSTHCVTLWDGQLHQCPRSAHAMDLSIIPDKKWDYVEVVSKDTDALRQQLIDFRINTKAISACDICDNARGLPLIKVKPAIQRKDYTSTKPSTVGGGNNYHLHNNPNTDPN